MNSFTLICNQCKATNVIKQRNDGYSYNEHDDIKVIYLNSEKYEINCKCGNRLIPKLSIILNEVKEIEAENENHTILISPEEYPEESDWHDSTMINDDKEQSNEIIKKNEEEK